MLGRHGIVFYGALGKFTWRMLATVLTAQGIVVFLGALVARGVASAQGDDRSGTWLWLGLGLSLLCFVGAGLVRRPWGVTLGWLLQLATFAAATVVPAMAVVGAIFLVLWVGSLVVCHRADEQLARREREAAAG
jgi:hypothetical protein